MILGLLAAALAAQPAPTFDPVEFFRGRTEGKGTIKIVLRAPIPLEVESLGTIGADGTLVVRQVIREGTKTPRTRIWRLKAVGDRRYSGTLTDAASSVRVEQAGAAVRIRYKDKDQLDIDQTLTPAGPRTLRNRMKVKRFGITVAQVDETIRKRD